MKKTLFVLTVFFSFLAYFWVSGFITSDIPKDKGIAVLLISMILFTVICIYIPRKIFEKLSLENKNK